MNNNLLYNAAFAGAFEASLPVPTSTSVPGLVNACKALALEIDELIANDANLSNDDGTTLVPTTGANVAGQNVQPALLYGACFAACSGHAPFKTTGSFYAGMAAKIVAQYTAAVTALAATLA